MPNDNQYNQSRPLTPARTFRINCVLAKELLTERLDAAVSQSNIEKLAHCITQIELNKRLKRCAYKSW